MCWNADISLNTFLFACLAIGFIWAANTFTKYKTDLFDHKIVYLFFLAVAGMQLVEFFLWKNLKNASMNSFFSKIAGLLIVAQHVALLLLVPSPEIRRGLLLLYAVVLGAFLLYKKMYSPFRFRTSVAKNGHLSWDWLEFKGYEIIWMAVGLLFYLVPLMFIPNKNLLLFVFALMLMSLLFYFKDGTFGTMWCWVSNLFLLLFIVDILVIKPFSEYNGLC